MTMATIHSSAVVDDGATLGEGTRIWHWVHVSGSAIIGKNCVLGQGVYIGNNVQVGDGVKIQNNVSVYEGVTIEEDVFLGPHCVFTNVINPRAFVERKDEYRPTLVKRGATIGANATILCGVTIGEYALVGAGAVVTHDVRVYTVVAGVPARLHGFICACGGLLPAHIRVKITGNMTCKECGMTYHWDGSYVTRKD